MKESILVNRPLERYHFAFAMRLDGLTPVMQEDGSILLVNAAQEAIYEIPSGKLNEGEDARLAAARELEEETGLIAQTLVLRFVLYPTPGYTNEKIYIYEALGVREGAQHLDEGEFLNVEYVPVKTVLSWIEKGELHDAKTIVALQQYALGRQ